MGHTDIRTQDNWAKTLRVAVWLHRLDMALRASCLRNHGPIQVSLGPLLGCFLAPGVAWDLSFVEVVEWVLQGNREYNERRQRE